MQEAEQQTNADSTLKLSKKRRSRLKPKRIEEPVDLDQSSNLQLLDRPFQTEKECRICLDHSETSQNNLIAPCKCTGSVKYVHDSCFRKWIEKQYFSKGLAERKNFLNTGSECELCKVKFSLIYSFNIVCCRSAIFQKQFSKNQIIFLLYLLLLLVDFGCLAFLCTLLASKHVEFESQLIISIVVIVAFALLATIAAFTVYHLFTDYFMDRMWTLEGYEEKRVTNNRNSNQVAPLDANNNN